MKYSLNEYFEKAYDFALTFSHDKDSPVGCIITNKEGDILTMGTNKFPKWFNHFEYDLKDKNKGKLITHAEVDCLNKLRLDDFKTELNVFITKIPCEFCCEYFINSFFNINTIYYKKHDMSQSFIEKYGIERSKKILNKKGISLIGV